MHKNTILKKANKETLQIQGKSTIKNRQTKLVNFCEKYTNEKNIHCFTKSNAELIETSINIKFTFLQTFAMQYKVI